MSSAASTHYPDEQTPPHLLQEIANVLLNVGVVLLAVLLAILCDSHGNHTHTVKFRERRVEVVLQVTRHAALADQNTTLVRSITNGFVRRHILQRSNRSNYGSPYMKERTWSLVRMIQSQQGLNRVLKGPLLSRNGHDVSVHLLRVTDLILTSSQMISRTPPRVSSPLQH